LQIYRLAVILVFAFLVTIRAMLTLIEVSICIVQEMQHIKSSGSASVATLVLTLSMHVIPWIYVDL
jgi:hypothetical protein